MAKKKIDKEAERTPSSPGRIVSIFKNETVAFCDRIDAGNLFCLSFVGFFFLLLLRGQPTKVLSTAATRQTLRRLITM